MRLFDERGEERERVRKKGGGRVILDDLSCLHHGYLVVIHNCVDSVGLIISYYNEITKEREERSTDCNNSHV